MGKAADALISGPGFIKPLILKETLGKALQNVHYLHVYVEPLKGHMKSLLVQLLSAGMNWFY